MFRNWNLGTVTKSNWRRRRNSQLADIVDLLSSARRFSAISGSKCLRFNQKAISIETTVALDGILAVCMFDYRIANSARTHVNTWRTWTLLSVQFFVPSRHIFFPRRSKKPGGQCRRRRRNASADNKTLRGGEGNGSAVGTSCVLVCESWIPGYCANI